MPARDESADVVGLRLREGAGASVARCSWVRARAGTPPEESIVPAQVDTGLRQAGLRYTASLDVAVLPLVLERVRRQVDGLAAGTAGFGPLCLAGFPRHVERIGVDDRYHDRSGRSDEVPDARAPGLVSVDELQCPLHRVLRRRPRSRLVGAEQEKDGLAIARFRFRGDLDAREASSLAGREREGDDLDQARIVIRQCF